jgi:glutaredoxin
VGVVTFVTRAGCTLCEEALPAVRRVVERARVELVVVDVDTDAALKEQWSDHVPVVLLDGVEHSRWWVDQGRLAKALRVRV